MGYFFVCVVSSGICGVDVLEPTLPGRSWKRDCGQVVSSRSLCQRGKRAGKVKMLLVAERTIYIYGLWVSGELCICVWVYAYGS